MSLVPNMIVTAPKDEVELRDLLYTAFRQDKAPFSIRYPRGNGVGVMRSQRFREIEIGSWEMLEQGREVALLAVGTMVHPALWARKLLARDGISCGVFNCRFIKPLDTRMLDHILSHYEAVVTVEENVLRGGFGSQVALYAAGCSRMTPRILHMGIPDEFLKVGKRSTLLERLGLCPAGIQAFVKNALGAGINEHSVKS